MRLLLAACWIRESPGIGTGREFWSQDTEGVGFPVALQSRMAVSPSLTVTDVADAWIMGMTVWEDGRMRSELLLNLPIRMHWYTHTHAHTKLIVRQDFNLKPCTATLLPPSFPPSLPTSLPPSHLSSLPPSLPPSPSTVNSVLALREPSLLLATHV